MKLGVYSLVAPDFGINEVAQLIAELGYDAVEWTVDYPNAVWDGRSKWHISSDDLEVTGAAARHAVERYGLAVPCLGSRCNCFEENKILHYMGVAKFVRASAIRVMAPWYDASVPYDEMLGRARTAYQRVAEMAREVGVKALVEIHDGNICPSASATRRLLEGLDPQLVGAIFDPGNMIRDGMENWRMAADILGPYLAHVHVKNGAWVRVDGAWRVEHTSLADGLVDWKAVVQALKDVGYQGYLDIEDFRGGYACKPVGITTRQKLLEDIKYLRSLL